MLNKVVTIQIECTPEETAVDKLLRDVFAKLQTLQWEGYDTTISLNVHTTDRFDKLPDARDLVVHGKIASDYPAKMICLMIRESLLNRRFDSGLQFKITKDADAFSVTMSSETSNMFLDDITEDREPITDTDILTAFIKQRVLSKLQKAHGSS